MPVMSTGKREWLMIKFLLEIDHQCIPVTSSYHDSLLTGLCRSCDIDIILAWCPSCHYSGILIFLESINERNAIDSHPRCTWKLSNFVMYVWYAYGVRGRDCVGGTMHHRRRLGREWLINVMHSTYIMYAQWFIQKAVCHWLHTWATCYNSTCW